MVKKDPIYAAFEEGKINPCNQVLGDNKENLYHKVLKLSVKKENVEWCQLKYHVD